MKWLKSSEVSALLGISVQAVHKAAKEGKYGSEIKYEKGRGYQGKVLLIPLHSLPVHIQDQWLKTKSQSILPMYPALHWIHFSWKAESASIVESDMTFEALTITAKTLVAMCRMSVELLEDAQNIDQVVQSALSQALALEWIERLCLASTPSQPDYTQRRVCKSSIWA